MRADPKRVRRVDAAADAGAVEQQVRAIVGDFLS
jgi:hypothetical protein